MCTFEPSSIFSQLSSPISRTFAVDISNTYNDAVPSRIHLSVRTSLLVPLPIPRSLPPSHRCRPSVSHLCLREKHRLMSRRPFCFIASSPPVLMIRWNRSAIFIFGQSVYPLCFFFHFHIAPYPSLNCTQIKNISCHFS